MFTLAIKKTISDLWENFIPTLVINLVVIFPFLLGFSFTTIKSFPQVAIMAVAMGGIVISLIFLGAAGPYSWVLADYRKAKKADFFSFMARGFGDLFWSYSIFAFLAAAVLVAVPFYLEKMGASGIVAAGLVIATGIIFALASPYYLAVRSQKNLKGIKAYKEAFRFLFQNLGYGLIMGLIPLITLILAVSVMQFVVFRDTATLNYFTNMGFSLVFGIAVFVVFFLPGPVGYLVFFQNSYRIRILGDQYRIDHPDHQGSLPWKEILATEMDLLSQRKTNHRFRPWQN